MKVTLTEKRPLILGSLTAGTGTQYFETIINDYNGLINKPSINGVEVVGDLTSADLGSSPLSNLAIEALIQSVQL